MRITINNPCSQNRADMRPVDSGLHCALCNQVVVDFTKMSDAELYHFLQHRSLGCGIYRAGQLNRDISLPVKRKPPFSAKWLFAITLFFGWMKNGKAQQKAPAGPAVEQGPVSKKDSMIVTRHKFVKPVCDPRAAAAARVLRAEDIEVMGGPMSGANGIATRPTQVYQRDSAAGAVLMGGGSPHGTTYIVDGIQQAPSRTPSPKRRLWSRLQFRKKKSR